MLLSLVVVPVIHLQAELIQTRVKGWLRLA